jgi:restriction system protein
MTGIVSFVLFIIVLGVIAGLLQPKKRQRKRTRHSTAKQSNKINKVSLRRPNSLICRPDNEILSAQLNELSGPEFERLLALYFRDKGYIVKEVGVGGNDGGVDLVIIDKRGEKTAVQAKCYADHNAVPVQTVRELVAAKRNHDCILSLLITTSDLTLPAKREAEQFRVEYWHGGLVEQKLMSWGKWQPNKFSKKKA